MKDPTSTVTTIHEHPAYLLRHCRATHSLILVWLAPVGADVRRVAFDDVLEFLRELHTPNLAIDLRELGAELELANEWNVSALAPVLEDLGVRRLAYLKLATA